MYDVRKKEIQNYFIEADALYIIFDETTDSCDRYILNILLGKCSSTARNVPKLIASVELNKTNAKNVTTEIINRVLEFLRGSDMKVLQKIFLLLSDGAPYAVKAEKILKEIIPKLKHITSLCHALHNLSETIRYENFQVDKIMAFLKRSLVKNKGKKRCFLKQLGWCYPIFRSSHDGGPGWILLNGFMKTTRKYRIL